MAKKAPCACNILIYDADCRFCVASKNLIERWDRRHRITFLPFQTEEATRLVPELGGTTCIDAMRFIDAEERVYAGVDAFRKMLPFLPAGYFLSALFYIPGFSWVARKSYHWIAENRYRWFGKALAQK